MSKKYFLPRSDSDKQPWLANFSAKLPAYATKYGIATADVTDMQDSSTYYTYWLNYLNQYNEYLRKVTEYKNEIRNGAAGKKSVVPVPPVLGAIPTAVDPGVFNRAAAIAGIIKSNNNYTEADGKDLGLEGELVQQEDINSMKPVISIRLVNGGHPEILWVKKHSDGIDIQVDRGNGVWAFLATDTVPNYIDTFALPAQGASATWKYRCIYRVDDEQVGMWSDVVSITVAG